MDAEGKHYRRVKNAIRLSLHLVLHADQGTGCLKRKYKTLAEEMGLAEGTIRKWLTTLKKHGYIEARSNGRCLEIVIKRWKTLGGYADRGCQNVTAGASRLLPNG